MVSLIVSFLNIFLKRSKKC